MGTIWELDFYSRPILDENQKKLWEVLICESPQQISTNPDLIYKYAQFCPSTSVNSLWLAEAIKQAIAESGQIPSKIRFFRRQMKNMITKACEEVAVIPVPSRRTHTLNHWIVERLKNHYPTLDNYDSQAINASVQYPPLNAIALPDAVRGDKGDKWTLVTLPVQDFIEMDQWDIAFGEAFPLSLYDLDPQLSIPGVIIFSNRAIPLAGWLSGLEIGSCYVEDITPSTREIVRQLSRLRLETGLSDSWILADITDEQGQSEARGFTKAKNLVQQIHFLAIQSSPESDSFAGLWLLKDS
ncbi:Tab2/Atab2 family RNA-binding protein [Gloeocapsa sp. PCC 73106]|uniref:Tab2/Atab2 family RNA-binding protein n=1 Tax=Gloeocapsa sp. PCC 73106 TaxID=102232 RepID=UPI0002AC8263|nr:Tab2/Atab2 family RNA-binding protein [Gloeocapsa sp. PCC 73106]ELR97858.1 Protein of unknown function (DUF1092) [Gloeocapsa sp. PCC 73106]